VGIEAPRKFDEPRLIADRKERAGNLLHGPNVPGGELASRPVSRFAVMGKAA
jgi:hypothetical protein